MTTAILRVRHAGPLVTIQDSGRPAQMRFGVPASGPMDPFAFRAANLVLGQLLDMAAIEISLGGLVVDCDAGPITLAVCGGMFRVEHNAAPCNAWTVVTLHPGDNLRISAGEWGSWCYLAVSGVPMFVLVLVVG
jgi:5-oxoprolinase (ATP-hydrolysing) subunit C